MKKNMAALVTIARLVIKNGGPAKWLEKVRVESQEQDRLILALRQDQEEMQYALSLNAEREQGWQNRFRYLQYCYDLEKLTTKIGKIPQPLPSIKTTHSKLSRILKDIRDQQIRPLSYQHIEIDGLMEELNTLLNIENRDNEHLFFCKKHEEWYDTEYWSCCQYCWEERESR